LHTLLLIKFMYNLIMWRHIYKLQMENYKTFHHPRTTFLFSMHLNSIYNSEINSNSKFIDDQYQNDVRHVTFVLNNIWFAVTLHITLLSMTFWYELFTSFNFNVVLIQHILISKQMPKLAQFVESHYLAWCCCMMWHAMNLIDHVFLKFLITHTSTVVLPNKASHV